MGKLYSKIASLLIITCVLSISNLQAQAPLGFNYQGVALTNTGTPVNSKVISLRIALIESQQLGTVRYQEVHNVSTDSYGQFSIIIGNGQVVTGKMSDVQWSKFPYYMKVELDLAGGTAYVFVGTSQLLSVPYALYANNAGAASISVDSLKNELATIKLIQKGDSIVLNNNRGGVYIPKIDSLAKIVVQLAGIKSGVIKYIRDSVTKIPFGLAIGYDALKGMDTIVANANNYAIGNGAGSGLLKSKDSSSNNDNILIGTASGAALGSVASGVAMQNIIIGNNAAKNTNPLASQNVIIGYEAAKNSNGVVGTQTSIFNNNVAIGNKAGYLVSNGSGNVILGSNAGNNTSFSNISNKLIISNSNTAAPLIYGEFDNKKFTINGDLIVTGKLNGSSGSIADSKENIAAGSSSLANNKTGYGNVALGSNALNLLDSGSNNIAIGANALSKMVIGGGGQGSENLAIGSAALMNSTGNGNTAVGTQTLQSSTKAYWNVALGEHVMRSLITGSNNVGIGYAAMINSTGSASNNTIIGHDAGHEITGDNNTALGNASLQSTTTGEDNVAIGAGALYSNKTGGKNIAIGRSAYASHINKQQADGDKNIAIGYLSLYNDTSGVDNTSIGAYSMTQNLSGSSNVGLGNFTLQLNTIGSNNVAIAPEAMHFNTTGNNNIGIGYASLYRNTTGSNNSALGFSTLNANTTGYSNTAFGLSALQNNTTGFRNTAVGDSALMASTTGEGNTAIGMNAMLNNTTGFWNTGIGIGALQSNTRGDNNTAVGRSSMLFNTTGIYNVSVGSNALNANTTGWYNTVLGSDAMYRNTTGIGNTSIGNASLASNTTASYNVGVGYHSLYSNTTGNQNTAIGSNSLGSNTTGTSNNAIGLNSLYSNTTGGNNYAFGTSSLYSNLTSNANIAIGSVTLNKHTTGDGNIAIGHNALYTDLTGYSNSAIGYNSMYSNTTGYNNTAVGQGSLFSTTEGPNNVAVGVSALKNNVVGSRNVAIGVGAMEANLGSVNNAVGYFAMKKNTTGDANNAFGHQALEQNTTGVNNAAFGHSALGGNVIGNGNAAFGYAAAGNNKSDYNAAFGMGALGTNQNGSENAAFGSYAITNATGSKLTAVGAKAGESNSTGINNTYIGAYANTSTGTISNSTAIGYNAQVTASNQIQLGNANVTMVKSAGVLTSSRGLLPPKFSAVERDAIVDPEQGLTIYCYNCGTYGELQVFNGNAWVNAIGSATAAAITDVTAGLVASFPLDGTAAGTNTSTATQVSTVTKAMTSAWTYTLPATDPNKTYKMVVSGTWGIANSRAHRDAAYDANSNNTIGSTGTPVANRGCDANWVFEGNCAPPAPTSPSGYASNNTYEYYIGNGKSGGYSLAFTDGSYGDNVGSLTFTLYEVGIAGSTTGTVTYTTNRKGTANSAMQGGSGYITAPTSIFQFTRTQAFTVSVWFTADAVESSGRLLSTESPEGHFRIGKYDLNNIAVQYGDYITQTVSNNDWHHLVYTYNNRLEKVYMDGVLVQTNTDTSTEALSYSAPFTIGAKASSAFDKWAGKIDDVKVYNRALLPNEVLVLFNQ